MDISTHSDRVRSLYQMLFEMATGNFTCRFHSDGQDVQLDQLGNLLNSVAEAMQQTIIEAGYINPQYSYQCLTQTTFVLNDQYIIVGLSAGVSDLLGYRPEQLVQIPFENFLSIQSIHLWQKIIQEAHSNKNYHHTVQLIFVNPTGKLVPSFCTISRLLYADKILVSTISAVLQQSLSDPLITRPATKSNQSTASLIQNVHDYIINHLEEPLPSVKELSKLFGTNEFKIKEGFRQFFNTSVYQFYNEERLKKAHLLIQQTSEPLKNIAYSCGFSDYVNFYKAFKKRFGYAPSAMLRQSLNKPDEHNNQ